MGQNKPNSKKVQEFALFLAYLEKKQYLRTHF